MRKWPARLVSSIGEGITGHKLDLSCKKSTMLVLLSYNASTPEVQVIGHFLDTGYCYIWNRS